MFGVTWGLSELSSLQLALPRYLVTAIWSKVRDRGVRVDEDPLPPVRLITNSGGELRFYVESTLINVKNYHKA